MEDKNSPQPMQPASSNLPDLESVLQNARNEATQSSVIAQAPSITQTPAAAPTKVQTPDSSLSSVPKAPKSWVRWLLIGGGVVLILVLAFLLYRTVSREINTASQADGLSNFGAQEAPLRELSDELGASSLQVATHNSPQLTVNGRLNVNGRMVIAASTRPANPVAGELWYQEGANRLFFYNGTQYIDMTSSADLANTLQQLRNELRPTVYTAGNGISVDGATISNTGVTGLTSGTPLIQISNNGNGQYVISENFSGALVLLQNNTPGTAQAGNINITGTMIAANFVGDGSQLTDLDATNIATGTLDDARLSANVTLMGNTFNAPNLLVQLNGANELPAVNGVNLLNLNASNIATGTLSDSRLSANVTLMGNTFNGANQLVQLTALGYLPALNGSLVTNINADNIATGTLNDARLSNNVALLNGTQTFTGGNTFSGTVTASTIDTTAGLTVGNTGQSLLLQGNATTKLTATSGGFTTQIGFTGSPTGNINYNFDMATTPGTYTICTTIGNCAGTGGGVTTLGGTTNQLAKFTGAGSIGDSMIGDDGTSVTIAPTSNATTTFRVQNASSVDLLVADTTNTRIAIGQSAANFTLDVNGDINSTTGLRVGGNLVCDSSGCSSSGGSGFYIQNGTGLQTAANFNIESAFANQVVGVLRGAAGQTADLLQAHNPSGTAVAKITANGTFDTVTGYYVNGVQISSANLSNDSNLAKLNGTQSFTGVNTFAGNVLVQAATNAVGSFQIQNAAGTSNLLIADTQNTRIGIGTATPGYTLDVNGDVNISSGSAYRINGVAICGPTATCAPSSGSTAYIQNGTSLQSSANFNIQSGNAGSVVGILRGAVGQTANLLELQTGDPSTVFAVTAAGVLQIGAGGDTNLYRSAANTLATDDSLVVTGDVSIGANSSLKMAGGSSFPSSPTEGQVFYRSDTDQLYVYTGSRWQADHSTATYIVAASNSVNKEKADFVGDGTNDQNAINAAISALPSTGGSVILLDGTFNLAAGVTIDKPVTFQGAGTSTVLKRMYNESGYPASLLMLWSSDITITLIKIDGNKATYNNANNHAVMWGSVRNNIKIVNTTITNSSGSGAVSGWNIFGTAGLGNGNVISESEFSNNAINLNLDRFNGIIEGNRIAGSTSAGISVGSVNEVKIIGNYVTSSATQGITGGGQRLILSGNTVVGNTGAGIQTTGTVSLTITSNSVTGNGDVGIYTPSNRAQITGNSVYQNTGSGVKIQGDNGLVEGNLIALNNQGVEFNGGSGNLVSNNRLIDNTNGELGLGGALGDNKLIANHISRTTGSWCAINIGSNASNTYLASNTLSGTPSLLCITNNGKGTIYEGQMDADGNILTRGQAGIALNGTTTGYSLQNTGSFVQGGMSTPAAPAVITQGTTGSTSWSYTVTAYDGLGETLASTATTVTTGNATLNSSNFNRITPSRVNGAVSYRVYRTAAGGTPNTTGYIGTVSGGAANFYLDDTGLAASGSSPTVNTTGLFQANNGAKVLTGNVAAVGLVVQGAASQSANLQEWQTSNGTVVASINADGTVFTLKGTDSNLATFTTTSGNALVINKANGIRLVGNEISGRSGSYVFVNADASRHGLSMTLAQSPSTPILMMGSGWGAAKTNAVQVGVRAGTGQSYNIQEWQNSAGTALSVVGADGSMGIGNSTPGYMLHVGSSSIATDTTVARFENAGGTCDVTPNVVGGITCTSDERLKKNIVNYDDALNKILGLNVVGYNYLNEADGSGLHVGVLAQDLEQIMPDLVITDAQGNKSVSYAGLTPYLAKALQQQQQQIDALQAQVGGNGNSELTGASLNVSGAATVASLTVTGAANVGSITVVGNATIGGNIMVNGHIIGNADTRGTVTVPAGATEVEHIFTTPYGEEPNIILTAKNTFAPNYRVEATTTGFKVFFQTPATEDTVLNYQAQQ